MLRRNLDIVFGIIGLVLLIGASALLVYVEFHIIYVIALLVGIACIVLYLLIRNKIPQENESGDDTTWLINLIYASVFIVCSFSLYILRIEPYVKPLIYYFCIAIGTALIFITALNVNSRKQVIITLCAVAIIGLLHLWTESLLFPSVIGMDAWQHQRITMEEMPIAMVIKDNFHGIAPLNIMTIGGYYSLMHVYIYNLVELMGLSYKMTVLIFWSSIQVIGNVIFAYLIGNELYNKKIGIVAALMLTMASWVIFFNAWAIPNAIGFTFSLIVAYLMLKLYKTHKYWLIAPIIIIAGASFLTHIIVSLWVIGIVMCIAIVPQIFIKRDTFIKKVGHIIKSAILPAALVILFICWLNFTWLGVALFYTVADEGYKTYPIGKSIEVGNAKPASPINIEEPKPETGIKEESETEVEIKDESKPETEIVLGDKDIEINAEKSEPIMQTSILSEQLSNGSLDEFVINSTGMLLYIGFAVIGGLAMLRYKIKPLNITWVILCYTVLAIGLIPPLFGMSLIEHRWWGLSQAFMAIPLAVILVGLCNITKRNYGVVVVTILVGIMAFMSTIGLPTNLTNRTISKNQIVRYAFTEKELEGLVIAETYQPKRLGSDSFYLSYIQSHIKWCNSVDILSITVDGNIFNADFSDCTADVIVLRDALYKEPFAFGSGAIYKLNYNPIELAKTQGYREVYNNGEIHCLVKE